MRRVFLSVAAAVLVTVSPSAQPTARRVIAPPGPKPVGPYSPGIAAGDFLYVSGQGARDREGKLPDTVEAQVRQTLDNVKLIVEADGLTMEHVVYSQVYLDTMAKYLNGYMDSLQVVWARYTGAFIMAVAISNPILFVTQVPIP